MLDPNEAPPGCIAAPPEIPGECKGCCYYRPPTYQDPFARCKKRDAVKCFACDRKDGCGCIFKREGEQ